MFQGESFGLEVLGWLSTVFIFVVGLFVLFLPGVFIADITQTKHAIRRNYPVIGHLRYFFEHMGTFFRQYFLPWTVKKCRSTGHNVPRCIVLENGSSVTLEELYPCNSSVH